MGEKLLLDTHTLIWWKLDPKQLSAKAISAIQAPDNFVFFSPVSAMEIATKVRIGKLEIARPLATNFVAQMEEEGFRELAVTSFHAEVAGNLAISNQDPWDRLLLAQAQVEQVRLISADRQFAPFLSLRLW